jgi:hypothetical protein
MALYILYRVLQSIGYLAHSAKFSRGNREDIVKIVVATERVEG